MAHSAAHFCWQALALLGVALSATHAHAGQSATPPSGLDWQMMNESVFDAQGVESSARSMERTFAQMIWGNEPQRDLRPGYFPSPGFAMVAVVDLGETMQILSLLRRRDLCKSTGAGSRAEYAICPMRVLTMARGGRQSMRTHAGYCYLNFENEQTPRWQFHTEFAFDPRTSTAYFRTIQSGKLVPECNRSIQLSK